MKSDLAILTQHFYQALNTHFSLTPEQVQPITFQLTDEKEAKMGDIASNAALMLTRILKKNPRRIAEEIISACQKSPELSEYIEKIDIAGPGFLNFTLKKNFWNLLLGQLNTPHNFFTHDYRASGKSLQKYLIEFVSANPTGPMHLGHGRNAILGDILARVLRYVGHTVDTEFYINDAGSQIGKLGISLKARILQVLDPENSHHSSEFEMPEGGYHGEYITDLARELCKHENLEYQAAQEKSSEYYAQYALEKMLELQKRDLLDYGVSIQNWFSEKSLYQKNLDHPEEQSPIDRVLKILEEKQLVYREDGALWFKATEFGDDKDRVLQKADGSYTYITPDIAYHAHKFDRGYDHIIDILGQDHHGYVLRLKGTMEALGYNSKKLDVILYQLVSLTENDVAVKMSKRAGTFTTVRDIIQTIGKDAARFFYLNKKADAHLEIDLSVALKQSNENPVYYLQYAYVRTGALLKKAEAAGLSIPDSLDNLDFNFDEILVIKKMAQLRSVLSGIAETYQTHLLAFYALELAHVFHRFYTNNIIIDKSNKEQSERRLALTHAVREVLGLIHELLGLQLHSVM